jgi:hypothetical protein
LVLFNQFVKECGLCPAIAGWAEMRIPSGKDSSGVDGTLHLNVTKSITDKFRTHMEGFVETANGAQGGDDEDRRHFQWGVGPGFDYLLSCKTIAVLNYLNRSSEEYGHHNSNILEFGVAHSLTKSQTIKGALDVGLDGQEETPNLGVKLQWSYDW